MAEPKPARPPSGALRVANLGNIDGNNFVNRFWVHAPFSSTPTAAQVLTAVNAIAAAWRTNVLSALPNNVHVTAQRGVLYVDADTEIAVDGTDTGSGGAASTGTPSPQTCLLINWAIAGSYRGGHPRTYASGPITDHFDANGVIHTSPRAAYNTDIGNFLSAVNALTPSGFTSITLGTYRFFRGHAAVDPPVFEPFISGSCNPKVATQRRRVAR